MKKLVAVVLFACFFVATSLVQSKKEQFCRVYFKEARMLENLVRRGLTIIAEQNGVSLDIKCTAEEAAELAAQGFRIETLEKSETALKVSAVPPAQFYDYAEIRTFLLDKTAQYSAITHLDTIGWTVENRAIWALKISDNPLEDEDEPCFLVEGGIHGNEHHGIEAVINFIKWLLNNYQVNPEVTNWINSREIWCIPVVNPDGHELNQRGNESGISVDLNRNFGYWWSFAASSYGTSPFSEPETRAIRDLACGIKPYGSISFHTAGRLILYPWAYVSTVLPPDSALYMETGAELIDSVNAVVNTVRYNLRRAAVWYWHGGEHNDWMYSQNGMLSYTIEMTKSGGDTSQLENDIVLAALRTMLRRPDKQGITGIVTDAATGLPLQTKVTVRELFDEYQLKPYYTDQRFGRYIRFLVPGSYTVEFSAEGYEKKVLSISVPAREAMQIHNIQLIRCPIILNRTVINGRQGAKDPPRWKGKLPHSGSVEMSVLTFNIGTVRADSVYAKLTTNHPAIAISKDSIYIGGIQPGDTVTASDKFRFTINTVLPSDQKIPFYLDVYSSGNAHRGLEFFERIEGMNTDLETDDTHNWKHNYIPGAQNTHDDWQHGKPSGLSKDPASAHSDMMVWGTDLGGSGFNGAYQNSVNNYLELPAIATVGWSRGYLQFYRWLNMSFGDTAYISANNQIVWTNGTKIAESQWSLQTVDISSIASHTDSVSIRFGLKSNKSDTTGGWNIDDIMVNQDMTLAVPDDRPVLLPERFLLHQNYPNPFNSTTRIIFDLPRTSRVRLSVYNILGQEVKKLADGMFPAGSFHFVWNGDNNVGEQVAGGIYFIRMLTEWNSNTIKVMLLK
jgi:hypothetical protein